MKVITRVNAVPLWRVSPDGLEPVHAQKFSVETDLEDMVESAPDVLGEKLLVIGRQVTTPLGRVLDLLALDENASTKVIELKRDRAKDDAVGQLVAYGAWAATLGRAELERIFSDYSMQRRAVAGTPPGLNEAFFEVFGVALPPRVNQTQTLTLVARTIDAATLGAVRFMRDRDLPISVHLVGSYSARGETWVTCTEWIDLDPARDRPISLRAQFQELHVATVAAVEQGTSQLLVQLRKQQPRRTGHERPFFRKGTHGDILCFALLYMPRFTTAYVPYSLLDALYDWWVDEQAALGVERVKPAHKFPHQLAIAIELAGGWRKERKYWDEDPSLVNERLRFLVRQWILPSRGQLLRGYARN